MSKSGSGGVSSYNQQLLITTIVNDVVADVLTSTSSGSITDAALIARLDS